MDIGESVMSSLELERELRMVDAKKMQDAGLIEEGMGFYPRVSNGPDYWQFYQSFGDGESKP